jgi:hypothetical protein
MRDIPIGKLSKPDIKSMLTEAFEMSKIINRTTATKKDNILYAEQLVHRLVQEVNYLHLERIEVRGNVQNKAIQTSFVIQSLGTIWHYVILGSSRLPVIAGTSQATRRQGKSDSPHDSNEQPFITTGRLLMNMLRLHHQHPTIHPPPTATLYNAWLYSCFTCSSVTDDALHTAEAVLQNLERNVNNGEDSTGSINQSDHKLGVEILPPPSNLPKPTKGMYNHVLLMYANRAGTVYGAAVQAEDLLMRMSKVGVHPSTDTFNRVLKAWAESPEKEGGNRAADVLHLMLTLSDDKSNIVHGNEIAPDKVSFGTVITAFMKRGQPEACQLILEEAVSYFASDAIRSQQLPALSQCWDTTFFGWSKSGRPDAPERMESLLNDGFLIHNRQYKVVPTKGTYVAFIEAHLKSGRPDRIDKAERYLNVLVEVMRNANIKQNQGNIKEDITATTREFDTVINAWFRSLDEFENIGINKDTGSHPVGYTSTRATNLLYQMLQLQKEGFTSCTPSSGSFHMCIESLCRTAGACITAAKKIKKVLSKSKDVDLAQENHQFSVEYKSSMKSFAIIAADKALEILDIAEERKLSTDSSYATLIQVLCRINEPLYTFKAAQVLERYEQKADEWNLKWQETKVWMYHTIFTAFSAIGTLQAAESALAILRRIPKSGKRAIDKNGIWIYTGVLAAFAKHPCERSCVVAMELFNDLMLAPKHKPELNNSINVDFCERVLWILADSSNEQRAVDACGVLNSIMERRANNALQFEPSTSCFNASIHALTQVRDFKSTSSSIQLLKEIITKYESREISQLPSKTAFDLVIRNCVELGSPEMLKTAEEVTILAEKYAKI